MFCYLTTHDGPVVEGLEEFEKVYAKHQFQYLPLRTLPAAVDHEGKARSAISRWHLTNEQRQMIATGADIMLEVMHFGGPLTPVRMMISDSAGEYFREWFAGQTRAPYECVLMERMRPQPIDPAQFMPAEGAD